MTGMPEYLTGWAEQCHAVRGDAYSAADRMEMLAAAEAALHAAVAAWPATEPRLRVTPWEPGIKSPSVVPPLPPPGTVLPATPGRVSVSGETYDHIKELASHWANVAWDGRSAMAEREPWSWLVADLNILAAAMGYHRNGPTVQDNVNAGIAEARTARRTHAAYVIERAWKNANDQQRDQIMGASPALVQALDILTSRANATPPEAAPPDETDNRVVDVATYVAMREVDLAWDEATPYQRRLLARTELADALDRLHEALD